ncbi:MAG: hypothetical protein DRJ55_04080, partial [Thermoprotei archaeon]
GRARFFKVYLPTFREYDEALKFLEERGVQAYSSDIPHEHKILLKTGLTALVVSGDEDGLRVDPPQLKTLFLKFYLRDGIIAGYTYEAETDRDGYFGDEETVLKELQRLLRRADPDIVVSNLKHEELLKTVVRRGINYFGLYGLGRTKARRPSARALEGRVFLDAEFYGRVGLAGLEERCRFSMLPPNKAYRLTYGRLVDMGQSYLALSRGYAVPPAMNLNVTVRTAWEIHVADKGGLIQQPIPGIYENVAALDFESMFPNLIIKYNISYETVTRRYVKKRPRGILVDVVEPALRRRLHFKRLRKRLAEPYRTWAEQRQAELKMLLVSCYGYSGNNYNRLGNPLTFEWINRIARRVMTQVIRHARKKGYRVIYGDTDSIFITRAGATAKDYEKLAAELRSLTGLPIKVDKVYRFLAFPADKAGTSASALKRYFGRLVDGELDIKGIEAARNDVPTYIRKFQEKLIDTLLDGESLEDVYGNVEKCLDHVRSNVEAILKRRVKASELVIRKVVRKKSYKSKAPHYIAAQHLRNTEVGAEVRYIYVAARSPNPYRRICVHQQSDQSYDAEKYVEMLLSAAETVLSCIKIPKRGNTENLSILKITQSPNKQHPALHHQP